MKNIKQIFQNKNKRSSSSSSIKLLIVFNSIFAFFSNFKYLDNNSSRLKIIFYVLSILLLTGVSFKFAEEHSRNIFIDKATKAEYDSDKFILTTKNNILLAPTSSQLLIDIKVTNSTPSSSQLFKYKVRYRYASTSEHGTNAQVQLTFPNSYEIVSIPLTGGNISSVAQSGNQYTISLGSPSFPGVPSGGIAAGSSGIFEFSVKFPCGVNGSGVIPAAGSTVNLTQNPVFTVSGVSNSASTPTAVTVPTVDACSPPPSSSGSGIFEKRNDMDDFIGTDMLFRYFLDIPAHSSSYVYIDDFPDEMKLVAGMSTQQDGWFSSNFATIEVQATNGTWYDISSYNSIYDWIHTVAEGATLLDGSSNPIPNTSRVDVDISNSRYTPPDPDESFTADYAEGIVAIRLTTVAAGIATDGSYAMHMYIPPDTPVGTYQNCLTTTDPMYPTPDCDEIYITDMGSLEVSCSSWPTIYGLGYTTIPPYILSTFPNLLTKDPLDYQLGIRATPRSKASKVENITLETLVDIEFDFVETGLNPNYWVVIADDLLEVNDASALVPIFTKISDYNGTGQTLLRWEFPNLVFPTNQVYEKGTGTYNLTSTLRVYYSVRYMKELPLSLPFTVDTYLKTGTLMAKYTSGEPTQSDDCSLSLNISTSGGAVESEKYVKGSLDAKQNRYPVFGNTESSGDATYELYIYNNGFENVKQIDIADILPYIGDQEMLSTNARESEWSEELANAITVERFKIGTGEIDAAANIPNGILYSNTYNACYLDGGLPTGQVTADPVLANTGQSAGCTDFSGATPAAGAKGFAFRWLNSGDPLLFGEYLKITVNVTQLNGEADGLNNETAWNSFAYTVIETDDDILFSSEPIKVGIKMVDMASQAAFCGTIWKDENGNGQRNSGETLLENVTVSLYDASQNPITESVTISGVTSAVPITAITDSLGHYCFYGLNPSSTYYVRLENDIEFTTSQVLHNLILTTIDAAGIPDTEDSDASLGILTGSSTTPRPTMTIVTGAAGSTTNYFDAGFYEAGSVGNYVWYDDDAEGDQDGTENPVQGVSITLKDAITTAIIDTDITDANGLFLFENLAPGTYLVEASTIPAGKTPTAKNAIGNNNNDSDFGSNLQTDNFSLSSGESIGNIDLGLKDLVINPASICGLTWDDFDEDGVIDTGESEMENVIVQLLDASGFVLTTTTTDSNGDYCFYNLTPNEIYQIGFVLPSPTASSFTNAGVDMDANTLTGLTGTYTPIDNQNITNVDAGLIGPFSIGNLVWSDVNDNGIKDASESAISNVTLYLLDGAGTTYLDTTVTDAYGKYVFKNLSQGSYIIEMEVPNNTRSSSDITNTNTPNVADNDDNGIGIASTGRVQSAVIALQQGGGTSGNPNWTETDHGEVIDGEIDPASNAKAYYTVDFGLKLISSEVCDNGVDDDGDGLVDCEDPDCYLAVNSGDSDNDGDGIGDTCDLDDDNDGILDTDEGCGNVTNISGTIGIGSNLSNSTYSLTGTNITYSRSGSNEANVAGYNAGIQGAAILSSTPSSSPTANGTYDAIFSNPVSSVYFKLTDFDEYEDYTINVYDETNTIYDLTVEGILLKGTNINQTGNQFICPNSSIFSGGPAVDGNDPADDNIGSVIFYFSGMVSRIEIIYIHTVASSIRFIEPTFCSSDPDNDNVPSHLDLDSDGDGCPDAIEGDGSYINADLVTSSIDGGNTGGGYTGTAGSVQDNLGTSSNADGTPTAGSTQGIGSSQNPLVNACIEVCNDGIDNDGDGLVDCYDCADCFDSTDCSDNDNDGIGDFCDLDDDNDGILDVDEGVFSEFANWSWDGTSSGTGSFSCDVAPNFTYTITGHNSVSVDNSEDFDNTGQTFEAIYGEANNEENLRIVADGNSGPGVPITNFAVLNIIFDNPTSNLDWAFSLIDLDYDQVQITALDELGNPVTNTVITSWLRELFDADNTTGGIENPSWDATNSALVGSEDDNGIYNTQTLDFTTGSIEAPGAWFKPNISLSEITFSFSAFRSDVANSYHIHIASFCKPDTDTDGVADYLDLDSDNDGCPDAIEGGGSFTYSDLQNDTLTGGVDANGIPTVASGGQTIGTSQDSTQQSTECDPCNSSSTLFTDNDNDGIGDFCDLDDDNDGIPDVDECDEYFLQLDFANASSVEHNGTVVTGQTNLVENDILHFYNLGTLFDGMSLDGRIVLHSSTRPVRFDQGINAITLRGSNSSIDDYLTFSVQIFESGTSNALPFEGKIIFQDIDSEPGADFTEIIGFQHDFGVNLGSNIISSNYQNGGGSGPSYDYYALDPSLAGDTNNWVDETRSDPVDVTNWVTAFFNEPGPVQISFGVTGGSYISARSLYFDNLFYSNCDVDGDGIVNSLDLDSDNDGLYDAVEAGHGETHTNGVLTTAVGTNGLVDVLETSTDNGTLNYSISDSETSPDGIYDAYELDSDGDGCFDAEEENIPDSENDGIAGVGTPTVDANGLVTSITYTSPPNNTWQNPLVGSCLPEICNDGIDNDGDGDIDCADSDCSNITLSNLSVSGCIDQPLRDVATVSVDVSWINAPSNDTIEVSIGEKTEYIFVAAGATSPQSIEFITIANGTTGNELIAAWRNETSLCPDTLNFNAPTSCSSDSISCNILYFCGLTKPADGDAWDHGLMNYLDEVNGAQSIVPVLAKPDASGMGTYDPNNPTTPIVVSLSDYDMIFVSSTTEGQVASDLIDALKNYNGSILNNNYLIIDELGMSASAAGYNFGTSAYSNNTTSVEVYNYDNINSAYSYLQTRGDYLANADSYLWMFSGNQVSGINGIIFHNTVDDVLAGISGAHGSRTYLGFHMNGIYENAENGGAIPAPTSAYFSPEKHLTLIGKNYFDQAILLAATTCNDEICNDGIDNDGDGLIDCEDPDCYLAVNSGDSDNDGDGIGDYCDLDDDNDGIPDTDECVFTANINTGGSSSNESGVLSNGTTFNISTTGGVIFENFPPSTYSCAFSTGSFYNPISSAEGIFPLVPSGQTGTLQITFSQSLTEIVLNLTGIDRSTLTISGAGVTSVTRLTSNQQTLLSGTTISDVNSATVTEPNQYCNEINGSVEGSFLIQGNFSQLIFTYTAPSLNDGHAFTFADFTCQLDTDNDGILNSLDLDSDNDGIFDLDEAGHTASDANNDGVIDGANSLFGTNGLFDALETSADNGVLNYNIADSETSPDGIYDAYELDSDDDSCFDADEEAVSDSDNDGIAGTGVPTVDANGLVTSITYTSPTINYWQNPLVATCIIEICDDGIDNDGDGLIDCNDPDCISCTNICQDTDGDGIGDYCDIDDDNDGIPDLVESSCDGNIVGMSAWDHNSIPERGPNIYDPTIVASAADEVIGSGLSAPVVSTTLELTGVDQSSLQGAIVDNDYLEYSMTLSATGNALYLLDFLYVKNDFAPADNYGYFISIAHSSDGFVTNEFVLIDYEIDNTVNGTQQDIRVAPDSKYSILDQGGTHTFRIYFYGKTTPGIARFDDFALESGDCRWNSDIDGDGIPNHLDLDSDNDGIFDAYEAGHGETVDADGRITGATAGSGTNGLYDNLETSIDNDILNYFVADSEVSNDGIYDAYELDSDGDGCFDAQEENVPDSENDGIAGTGIPTVDGNGLVTSITYILPPNNFWQNPLIGPCLPEICDDYIDNDGDGNTDCTDTDCIPQANPATLLTCDNSNGTGSGIFFLYNANPIVTTSTGVAISYHGSLSDAQNDINILVSPYSGSNGTVYVRVERISTGCFNTALITLDVGVICLENCINGIDDDGDGLIDCDDTDCPCCDANAPNLNDLNKNAP